jgi:Holliday junction resolvase-like predicted endonuclease
MNSSLPISTRSSRHSKITGNFGEALMLYWLSKRGFECANIDHVGIDLIARQPASEIVLGISVKSRSRTQTGDEAGVNLLEADDDKIKEACTAFKCEPYVAFVVDQGSSVHGYLTTLEHARDLCIGQSWRMSASMVRTYQNDPEVEWFELSSKTGSWPAARSAA